MTPNTHPAGHPDAFKEALAAEVVVPGLERPGGLSASEVLATKGWFDGRAKESQAGLESALGEMKESLVARTLRILHYQLNILVLDPDPDALHRSLTQCQDQLLENGVCVLRINGREIHRANDFVLAVGRGMGFPEDEVAGEYFYERITQLRYQMEEHDTGWERPVVMMEGLAPEDVHKIFGRLRDEVWSLPLVWLVAGDPANKAMYLRPPADSFFAKVIEFDPQPREL